MRKLIYIIVVGIFWACSPEEISDPYPCIDGDCNSFFEIDTNVNPGSYLDNNGYWHVPFAGPKYFTVKGEISQLNDEYIVNGVPLIETIFDSDYWVWIDGLTFTVPLYSVIGFFTGGGYVNPINVGNLTYTIEDMADIHPPLNIAGYQINKHQCLDCPYSPTLFGTYSKYTYEPKQQMFFDREMVGDTAKVMIRTTFNSDTGIRVEMEKELKIIFE